MQDLNDQLGGSYGFDDCTVFCQSMCDHLVILVPVCHKRACTHYPGFPLCQLILPGTVITLKASSHGWTEIHKENIKFPVNLENIVITLHLYVIVSFSMIRVFLSAV